MIALDTLALVCWLGRQKALSQAAHDAIDRELDGGEILIGGSGCGLAAGGNGEQGCEEEGEREPGEDRRRIHCSAKLYAAALSEGGQPGIEVASGCGWA